MTSRAQPPRKKPQVATDRAALMLLLVPYLISRGEVSLIEAADEFDVSTEAMRAMVEKLTVIGRPGDAGYWQMPQDMFDIDWDLLDDADLIRITNVVALERAPKLSAREAAALIAGLGLARSLPGVADSGVVSGLLKKLSRGASSAPAEVIVAPGPVDDVRVLVSDALRRGVAVSFTYQAPDASPTTRTVDPVKVLIANGQWYLQGWCHLREGMRTFHLERVSGPTLTDIPITHGGEPVPDLFETGSGDLVATLRFPESIAPLLGEYLERAQSETVDGITTATLRVVDAHSLKRLAARRGGAVEIVEPVASRRTAAEWAAAGLDQYR